MQSYLVLTEEDQELPVWAKQIFTQHFGGLVSLEVGGIGDINLRLGQLDPDNVILFSPLLGSLLFEYEGKFRDIAYTIRQFTILGKQRRLLVLPHGSDCNTRDLDLALERLAEIA